ncbi:MAG: rRNA pseudouridine synthase [Candidatus Doudnabacteria bacterium]|nr:rRNA pseudouridine synthase [Candidatus Doudnabacteria bacterium]
MLERLQKFMSSAGVASRRHAEKMILAGLVRVNGKVVKELGTKVDPDKDKVTVDGKKVEPPKNLIYLAMNKPKRYMTTRDDPRKRKTVFEFLPPELRNVVWPIGRLDFNTEGLLLFTNDGDLTQKLTHPSFEHEKEYEVQLDKELSAGRIEKIQTGMIIDGKKTAPAKLKIAGTTVYLTIHEGMNRQVRKMFGELGYSVRNLKRTRIGQLKIGDLASGKTRSFNPQEVF